MVNYLTKEKYEELKKELEERKTSFRAEIADNFKKAKDYGDISENAEFDAAREAKQMNEGRIFELEEILRDAEIVSSQCENNETIQIGCKVKVLVSGSNEEREMVLVGPYEGDPTKNFISIESPMGKALLNKRADDEVEIRTPKGATKYKIVKIN